MALTPEQIDVLYLRSGLGKFHLPSNSLQCEYDRCIHDFAHAVDAEVRKDDEALIRQLLAALENHDGNYKLSKSAGAAVDAAITAARARLEKAP